MGKQWATFEGRQLIPDSYVGGDMIFKGQVLNYLDCAFRVIPEPATLLLLGFGAMTLRKEIKRFLKGEENEKNSCFDWWGGRISILSKGNLC